MRLLWNSVRFLTKSTKNYINIMKLQKDSSICSLNHMVKWHQHTNQKIFGLNSQFYLPLLFCNLSTKILLKSFQSLTYWNWLTCRMIWMWLHVEIRFILTWSEYAERGQRTNLIKEMENVVCKWRKFCAYFHIEYANYLKLIYFANFGKMNVQEEDGISDQIDIEKCDDWFDAME